MKSSFVVLLWGGGQFAVLVLLMETGSGQKNFFTLNRMYSLTLSNLFLKTKRWSPSNQNVIIFLSFLSKFVVTKIFFLKMFSLVDAE